MDMAVILSGSRGKTEEAEKRRLDHQRRLGQS
jgi:hypothetical protein